MGTVIMAPCISTAKAGTVRWVVISAKLERALMKVEIMMLPTSTRAERSRSVSSV